MWCKGVRSKTEATHSRNKGCHIMARNRAGDLDLEEEHTKRASTVFTNKKRTGAKREEAPHAFKVPPPDGQELGEGDPPVHAVGEHANRHHVGALVVDEAARDDQLGDRVAVLCNPSL